MNTLVEMLGVLSIFHIIGGIALGSTFRKWRHKQFSCSGIYMIVWGGLFGGAPLLLGAMQFIQHNVPYLILAQVGIFAGAIAVTTLLPDWFVEAYSADKLAPIGFGGLFLLVGVIAGIMVFPTDPFPGLVLLLVFGGVGALVFASGVRKLFKDTGM